MRAFTLQAIATRTGYLPRAVASATYTVTGALPGTKVGAGDDASFVARADGTLFAWGFNSNGQIGNGGTARSRFPVGLSSPTGVTAMAGSTRPPRSTAAGIWAWGLNSSGQLGTGSTATQILTPTLLTTPTGVLGVATGANHTLAVTSGGSVYAWGANASGQLGNNSTALSRSPIQVPNVTGAVAAAAGKHA